jgi:hypothetical protein
MKKQNVNNKLAFNKAAVTELSNSQLRSIMGGTGTLYYPSSIVALTKLIEQTTITQE